MPRDEFQPTPASATKSSLRSAALTAAGLVLCFVPAGCGDAKPTSSSPTTGLSSGAPIRYLSDGRPERAVDAPAAPAAGERAARPHIRWVCLDTVRADAFAPWAAAGQTPAMPRTSAWFAAHGVAFRQCSSTAPWTGPSIASMLTGLLPSRHGARELSDALTLVPAVATAAEILGAQGYATGAYTGGGWITKDAGFMQGVEEVAAPFSFGALGPGLLRKSTAGPPGGPPRFLFLHTYEAHDPYLAPPAKPGAKPPTVAVSDAELAAIDAEAETDGGRALTRRFLLDPGSRDSVFGARGRRRIAAVTRWFEKGFPADPQRDAFAAEARAVYEKGLARLDEALSAWLAGMDAAGQFNNSVVVLSSDHGEGFGEHRALHHGRRLYDELIHVPLYVVAPGFPAGKVVTGSCSLADILPTLLEVVGLPPAEGIDGVSLRPLLDGGEGRPVVAEERRTEAETGLKEDFTLVSVRDATRKWIRTTDLRSGASSEEAYDLAADPREEHPLPAGTADSWPAAFRAAMERARTTR